MDTTPYVCTMFTLGSQLPANAWKGERRIWRKTKRKLLKAEQKNMHKTNYIDVHWHDDYKTILKFHIIKQTSNVNIGHLTLYKNAN